MWLASVELATTPFGLVSIGILAAAIVLLWDWRVTLVSLLGVQLGLAANAVLQQGLPIHWALVESAVMGLACLILALSANHVGSTSSQYQAGTWALRLMTLGLVVVAWRATDIQVQLPEIDTGVSQLYLWLGVCALVTMSMSNNPFYIGAALLLWLIPVQAATSAILAIPSLTVLLGVLELLIALACSYMILVELEPENVRERSLTDIRFPEFVANPGKGRVWRALPMPHRQIWSATPGRPVNDLGWKRSQAPGLEKRADSEPESSSQADSSMQDSTMQSQQQIRHENS